MDLALLQHLQTYLTDRRNNLFQKVLSERTRHFTVVTEDVFQLHNTSAVMRTCDVFGIQDLHVVEEKVSKRIDKEIAMGAQKWVDFKRYSSITDCIQSLKNSGYQIIATTPHDNSTLLQEFEVAKKCAFFFGRESEGLSDIVMNSADGFLKIPMYGFTESLNISVSAAIILQSVVSKMKQANVNWQDSEEEKFELEMDWLENAIEASEEITERYYSENPKTQAPNSK